MAETLSPEDLSILHGEWMAAATLCTRARTHRLAGRPAEAASAYREAARLLEQSDARDWPWNPLARNLRSALITRGCGCIDGSDLRRRADALEALATGSTR
jgi:hypothetical protein